MYSQMEYTPTPTVSATMMKKAHIAMLLRSLLNAYDVANI
jgi:hypothetical protein